jgi:iron complex outermembrane receptor protein
LTANTGIRTDRGIFSLNYNYTRPKYGLQTQGSLILYANNPELLVAGREHQVWYQNLTNHLFSSDNVLFLGKNTLNIDLGYQMNTREADGGAFDPQQQALVAPTYASMQLNTFTYNVKFTMPANRNRIIVGVNGANTDNEADETKPNNPLLDSKIYDIGIYAIGDFTLSDKLNATAGLRYDYRNMQSFPLPTQTTDRFEVDNTYNNVTGSAGLTYNFSGGQFLKANVSSGFRSPTMPELTQNGIHSGRYERGDPDLAAQRNYQFDLNYHLHQSWFTIDVTPFYNIVDNYIYLVLTDEDAPIGEGKVFQHVQRDATLFGGEVALDIHPREWLGIHGAYSMVRAEIQGDTEGYKYPAFIPQDRLSGEIKLEQKKVGFLKRPFISVEVMHFLEQNRTGQNESVSPAYTLLHARIGATLALGKQSLELFINGYNLTNVVYIDHLSVTKPLGLNMMGRNLMLGLRLPLSFSMAGK